MKGVFLLATLMLTAPAFATPTAITGATVWTMTDDKPVENATIVINRGQIVSVTAHGPVPAGAVQISADHRIITPALVNAATQIGLGEVGGIDEERTFASANPGYPRDQLINHLNAAALEPVLVGTIPLVIQCDRLADIRQAISLARDYHLKVVLFGGAEAWAAAHELAQANIPVILDPMATLPDSYDRIGARSDSA